MKIVKNEKSHPALSSPLFINPLILFIMLKIVGGENPKHDVYWLMLIGICFMVWIFLNWRVKWTKKIPEISDEDIENAAAVASMKQFGNVFFNTWVEAAKWYREELKKRQ